MNSRRAAAIVSLVSGTVALALGVVILVGAFPRGLLVVALLGIAAAGAWYGLVGTPTVRLIGAAVAVIALGLSIWIVVGNGIGEELALVLAMVISSISSRRAFATRTELDSVAPPTHPVLFFNPRSGGGKAAEFSLAEEARARGFDAVELRPGVDLEELVRDAVAGGADALAMAGGDGSQAVVAEIASEHDLAYACIPAGTRNHFAADLGVDRDDVVGALDAFVDGGERVVDLGEVNGRVFVNNVSLGIYAAAVQRSGYRDAKVRTLLGMAPDFIGPESSESDLTWTGPGGSAHRAGVAILVSNNRYRLGQVLGSGTRPRIDDGLLGVTVLGSPRSRGGTQRPWRDWSAAEFEVGAERPVPAGIDGEAATLEPPLRFRIRPAALRVRIARSHPGASPTAELPDGFRDGATRLLRLALGRPAQAS